MILSVLYKGGLLMVSQHMTVGELSSFLMYTFWVGISVAGNTHMHTHVYVHVNFPIVWISSSVLFTSVCCVGLSSFYSELMKGFGAGTRLWELLDRKPEFPLDGQQTHTLTHSHRQESITPSHYPMSAQFCPVNPIICFF